eukprot:565809-Pleurochrysis_carterae.AAC.1
MRLGFAHVRGVVGPEVIEGALDRREEGFQILPKSRAAAVHGVRALRVKHLCRMEQRVGRLGVFSVPEATKDCHELTQRLGAVQPVLCSVSRHPHGEHR